MPWRSSNGHKNFYVLFRSQKLADDVYSQRDRWQHNWGIEPINEMKINRLNHMLKSLNRRHSSGGTDPLIKREPEEDLNRRLTSPERTEICEGYMEIYLTHANKTSVRSVYFGSRAFHGLHRVPGLNSHHRSLPESLFVPRNKAIIYANVIRHLGRNPSSASSAHRS